METPLTASTTAPAAVSAGRMPACPPSWYLACPSRDLPRGGLRRLSLPGLEAVVFRGRKSGRAYGLRAHCRHMGTDLGFGTVIEDSLRCPLHHWRFAGDGRCLEIPAAPGEAPLGQLQPSLPVSEGYGGVFVFCGPRPLLPPPALSVPAEDLRLLAGPLITLACPWQAVAANGFDMQHFETVHGRRLREPPRLTLLDRRRVHLAYRSQVTGRGLPDRLLKLLSGDSIEISITCFGGTVIAVESDLGRLRSALLLTLRPTLEGGTRVQPLFAIPRGRLAALDRLRLEVSRSLFSAFMRKDVAFMDGMRFARSRLPPQDPILNAFLDFLEGLGEPSDASAHPSTPTLEEPTPCL